MDQVTIATVIFFAVLAISSISILWWNISSLKNQLRDIKTERDQLRFNFDQVRKEKIETDDKLNQLQAQERTYKVAYEDWKSKYESLEQKYTSQRKDLESKLKVNAVYSSKESEPEMDESIVRLKTVSAPVSSQDSQLIKDLKSVLDQHLEILKSLISDDKTLGSIQKEMPSDPLHWIMGIDEDTSHILKNMGIRTFHQLSELARKDLKKMMVQFEDIEDKLIESWPMQATAILNSKTSN